MTRNQIIAAVIERLSGIPGLPTPELWRDLPAEFAQDWIGIRDIGEHYQDANAQNEHTLHLEVEIVTYGENAPLKSNDFAEIVTERMTVAIPNCRKITLQESEKYCQTGQRRSCQLIIKVDLTYRKNRVRD